MKGKELELQLFACSDIERERERERDTRTRLFGALGPRMSLLSSVLPGGSYIQEVVKDRPGGLP